MGFPADHRVAVSDADTSASWEHLDTWWNAYESSFRSSLDDASHILSPDSSTTHWGILDPWWNTYTIVGQSTAEAIDTLLAESTDRWRTTPGPFDTDPLATPVKESSRRGPLQPGYEEDWSEWLAQLLRHSPSFVNRLFGSDHETPPSGVRREEQLPNPPDTTRFADILVLFEDTGYSIEVKLGDVGYRKTPETARLVETHFPDHSWTHFLLLPQSMFGRLEAILPVPIETNTAGRPSIEPPDDPSIQILYWEDVSRALRDTLLSDEVPSDHWAASAYLLCSLAEQQILDYEPHPLIERIATPNDVVDAIHPVAIADTLERQLTYLETTTER